MLVDSEEMLNYCQQASGIVVPVYATVKLTFDVSAGIIILWAGSNT